MIVVCRCCGGSASVVHPPSWREVSSVGTSMMIVMTKPLPLHIT
jgi:hypothetical protein